jgi:hypothetical protein
MNMDVVKVPEPVFSYFCSEADAESNGELAQALRADYDKACLTMVRTDADLPYICFEPDADWRRHAYCVVKQLIFIRLYRLDGYALPFDRSTFQRAKCLGPQDKNTYVCQDNGVLRCHYPEGIHLAEYPVTDIRQWLKADEALRWGYTIRMLANLLASPAEEPAVVVPGKHARLTALPAV